MSGGPAPAFSILARSHTVASEMTGYSTTSAADAQWDALVKSNDQPTYNTRLHADMGAWELNIRLKAEVFSAMCEDRINTAYTPKAALEWKADLTVAEGDLIQYARLCPRGRQFGKLFLRYVEELSEAGRGYLEYHPALFERSDINPTLDFSSSIGSKPSQDSPITSFFSNNKPSLCESAPASRWPQRLSVQRNSGFKGGGVSRLRRDAVNARNEGGMSNRIAVPAGLQAASKASQRKSNSKATERMDESDSEWEDSDDDLQYFSAEED